MYIAIGTILLIVIGYVGLNIYLKRIHKGFLKYYDGIQKNSVKEANKLLNILLIDYSIDPIEEKHFEIYDLLSQNKTYVILTYLDNKDPNDNRTFSFTNSINFRKIKDDEIAAFTDFDIMRNYVGNYISTDIMLIGDFIKLCNSHNIKKIILNPTLRTPLILS